MGNQAKREQLKSDLILPWVIVGVMLTLLAAYIIICHSLGEQLQQPLPETKRVMIRTALYAVAIVTFPLTNLIRHIQLRLNQTMPRSRSKYQNDCMEQLPTTAWPQQTESGPELQSRAVTDAKRRYLTTIIVSMSLVEVVGVFGLVMFVLGDGFNTLYIFTGLSALGLFLYRPKAGEYSEIIEAIAAQKDE